MIKIIMSHVDEIFFCYSVMIQFIRDWLALLGNKNMKYDW
jgi:hypothetical protein